MVGEASVFCLDDENYFQMMTAAVMVKPMECLRLAE
jgi:hypothetical protein